MRNSSVSQKKRLVVALWLMELALIVLAVRLAAWLRFLPEPVADYGEFVETLLPRALLVALCITVAMAAFGLYQIYLRHKRLDFALRLVLSFVFGGAGLLVLYYALPQVYVGRGVLAIALALGMFGIVALRLCARHMFGMDMFKRRVLVLGAGENAEMINTSLRRRADRQSFLLIGFVPLAGQTVRVHADLLVPLDTSLAELARRLHIYEIVVAPDERRGGLPMEDMLLCAQRGLAVTDLTTFFEREAGMVKLNLTDPSWLVFSGGFDASVPRRLSKRCFDLIAACALLLVSWPLMLMTAVCVWLESGTPILYRQVRVGERGERFELVKFRSMRIDAECDGIARWASKDDARSTRVGRFIRLTRLDELPQLFNVLRGDMSFVGPRPERPQFVSMLTDEIRYYPVRHCVKPGLTGWAQLRYPYGASVHDAEEKLKFDLFYVKNQGFLFDLMILLQTVEVVLFGRGAR